MFWMDISYILHVILNHIPEFCRLLTNCRDFFIRANEIQNIHEIPHAKNCRQIRRLHTDAPKWLVVLCQKHMQAWFVTQEKACKYEYHFRILDESLILPYDQSLCWEILLPHQMVEVDTHRDSTIADFLHAECSTWYKKTQELNKSTKNKKEWELAPLSSTKISAWADDAFRYIEIPHEKFDPTDEYDQTTRKGIQCSGNVICLVMAKFFQLLDDCASSSMDPDAVQAATKQNDILSSYLSVFPKYSMIPKACPLFIVLDRFASNSEQKGRFEKACSDSKWLSGLVSSMRSVAELSQILNNFVPMGKDANMEPKCKFTICQSLKTAFERYDWENFRPEEGTLAYKFSTFCGQFHFSSQRDFQCVQHDNMITIKLERPTAVIGALLRIILKYPWSYLGPFCIFPI